MTTRHTRQAESIALKSMEVALAAPQVMAHRLTRMALAGPLLSDRDRREFQGMVTEKYVAFTQAWIDMSLQAWRANQIFATSMLGCFFPFLASSSAAPSKLQGAAAGILSKGLAPVHRKAVANARRLARTPIR